MSEAKKAKSTKARRATLTAQNGNEVKAGTKKTTRGMTTLCHNTAIIFPKELHAVLPWKYRGKGAENKVRIQIDVVGDKVVLSSPAPQQ
jgi:hypothetical protein